MKGCKTDCRGRWMGYFRLVGTLSALCEWDEWLHGRLTQLFWKRWKRGAIRWQELISPGFPRNLAALGATGKSPWHKRTHLWFTWSWAMPPGRHKVCAHSPLSTTDWMFPNEPPDADPHVRWCEPRVVRPGRGSGQPAPPTRLR
jgi:hypothetical protein